MRMTCKVLLVLGLTALLTSPAMAQRGRGRGGFGGPGFFVNNKGVQKELKLTDDQKDKIKTINDDARQEGQSIHEAAAGDFQEMQKKMAALNKETMEKVSGVLTDDQKKAWKDLTGEPFEFKPDPGQF